MATLRLRTLILLPLLLLAGCFPIELDVRDGKLLIPREEGFFTFDPATGKAVRVAGTEDGKPVFARFSPDGKEVLTVVMEGGSREVFGPGPEFRFLVRPIDGGKAREVYKGIRAANVLYSPDGANLGVVQLTQVGGGPGAVPPGDLYLVPSKGGKAKRLAVMVGPLFRWFPDSKRVLVFQSDKNAEQVGLRGSGSVVDVGTGKATPVVAVVVSEEAFFDLSPDGKKVLFTAFAAAKPGTDLAETNEGLKLFELDVAAGTVRKIGKEVSYAIYSRDGKQVLLGTPPGGSHPPKLEVADADLKKFTTVADDVWVSNKVLPGWLDDKTVFYFVQKAVYGTEGNSLHLMAVGADGKGRRDLQPSIDAGAVKDAK
jgi:hypothetical protein